jgi:hypothetical protein
MKQLIIIVNLILLSFTINAENDTCQILQISETDTVFTCEVDTCEDCIVPKVDTIIEVNEKYIKSPPAVASVSLVNLLISLWLFS